MFRYDKKINQVAHKRIRPSLWLWIIVCLQMAIFAGGVHAIENRVVIPFVMGQSEKSAVEEISRIGLVPKLIRENSSFAPVGDVIGQEPSAGMELSSGSVVNLIISLGMGPDSKNEAESADPKEIVLPNFIGMMLDYAEEELQRLGVGTSVIDQVGAEEAKGQVIGQKPPAGSKMQLEGIVELLVSDGPAKIVVPNLIGKAEDSALFSIGKSGLMIGRITEKSDNTIVAGNVIGQAPVAGSKLETDGTVDLIISSGPQNGDQPFNNKTIQKSYRDQPINLRWKDKTLGEILEEVELASGIKFKASASVKEESITTQLYAATWTNVVRKLLKNYSTMEVSNSNGDLVKVWIMSGSAGDISGKTGRVGRNADRRKFGSKNKRVGRLDPSNLSRMKKKLKLSRSVSKALYTKLKEIKAWPAEKKLPSSMYRDSDLKDFLSLNGIESARDLNDTSKINRLKRAARKQMLIMKKRARASDIELE